MSQSHYSQLTLVLGLFHHLPYIFAQTQLPNSMAHYRLFIPRFATSSKALRQVLRLTMSFTPYYEFYALL